jgi:hypothetical protein
MCAAPSRKPRSGRSKNVERQKLPMSDEALNRWFWIFCVALTVGVWIAWYMH